MRCEVKKGKEGQVDVEVVIGQSKAATGLNLANKVHRTRVEIYRIFQPICCRSGPRPTRTKQEEG
jgi:hypothetical protein